MPGTEYSAPDITSGTANTRSRQWLWVLGCRLGRQRSVADTAYRGLGLSRGGVISLSYDRLCPPKTLHFLLTQLYQSKTTQTTTVPLTVLVLGYYKKASQSKNGDVLRINLAS